MDVSDIIQLYCLLEYRKGLQSYYVPEASISNLLNSSWTGSTNTAHYPEIR